MVKTAAPRMHSRRAVGLGSIETPIMTGTATMIQTIWR